MSKLIHLISAIINMIFKTFNFKDIKNQIIFIIKNIKINTIKITII